MKRASLKTGHLHAEVLTMKQSQQKLSYGRVSLHATVLFKFVYIFYDVIWRNRITVAVFLQLLDCSLLYESSCETIRNIARYSKS